MNIYDHGTLEGRGPVEKSEADIYFPTGSLPQARRDLSQVHWGRIAMICGEVTMQRAVRKQLGDNTIGKAFACLVEAGQLGSHLRCLCTSASIMVKKQEESDVHSDSQCYKPIGVAELG